MENIQKHNIKNKTENLDKINVLPILRGLQALFSLRWLTEKLTQEKYSVFKGGLVQNINWLVLTALRVTFGKDWCENNWLRDVCVCVYRRACFCFWVSPECYAEMRAIQRPRRCWYPVHACLWPSMKNKCHTLADPIKNQRLCRTVHFSKTMVGTQAAGKHIMFTLRRGHIRGLLWRKVSEQHVFETSLPCKKTRKDSEACIVRDLKARKCLDDFEGVFFIQPLLNYLNTTTPVFICTLSLEKQLILTTQWQCSSWEMPKR